MAKSYSTVRIYTLEHEWAIQNFSTYLNNTNEETHTISLKSSSFFINDNETFPNHKWHVRLDFYSKNSAKKDLIGMFAVLDEPIIPVNIFALLQFSIISNDLKIPLKHIVFINYNIETGVGFEMYKQPFIENPDSFMPNDTLIIICEMDVVGRKRTTSISNDNALTIAKNSLSSDLANLLESQQHMDVTFLLGDKRIRAHKAILAARSPVFSAMFEHAMKEANDNQVNIVDVDSGIFEIMLQYMYSNETSDINDVAMDLIYAADKYELDGLKSMCELSLANTISIENAAEILVIADRHNAKKLMEFTLSFISTCARDVINTPGYEAMKKDHSKLTLIMFEKLIQLSSYCKNNDETVAER